MTCKYKVKIKDIQYNYKVQMTDIQSKYKFKVFASQGAISETDPTIVDINTKINSLEDSVYETFDIQSVLYPGAIGRLNNSGSLISSQKYAYTSPFFYAKAGTTFQLNDLTNDCNLRVCQYSSPKSADFISFISNIDLYTVTTDNWYRLSVVNLDSSVTADISYLEDISGYVYGDYTVRVNTIEDLIYGATNGYVRNLIIENNINITSQITFNGSKNIYGNGHTLTGSSNINYLFYITSAYVNIEDLILLGANDDIVFVGGTSVCNLIRCDISHSYANDGIGVHASAKCYIYNCIIHDNYDEGVSTHDTSYCECYNSEFYKNGYEVGTDTTSGVSFGGLHFGGSKMGIAKNNYCHNNSSHGIGFITIDNNYSSNALSICEGNICINNVSCGINFGGASNIRCLNNMCSNNTSGIIFQQKGGYGNDGLIGNNSLFNNSGQNMNIWSGADNGLVFYE